MKKIWFLSVLTGLCVLLSGCASDADELAPSDITLRELEAAMNRATDPQGAFAGSQSYIMRQEIREKQFLDDDIEAMVEVKFMRPDKFALITYKDNKPSNIFCTNGKNGWVADCGSRRIVQLSEEELHSMLRFARLGCPGPGGYSSIFKKVELFRCSNRHGEFYRIDCSDEGQSEPVSFYVDKDEFLLRRVKTSASVGKKGSFDYEAAITAYGWRFGVQIPLEMEIRQLGAKQESKVIYYQLNPVIPDSDFLPPVFQ